MCKQPHPCTEDLRIDRRGLRVFWKGDRLSLYTRAEGTQAEILFIVLFDSQKTYVSRDRLTVALVGHQDRSERYLEVQLSKLRKRMKQLQMPFRIINKWGRGYLLEVVNE